MSRILVVDDSMEFKTLIACYFSDMGFTVEQADNGREGLAKAREFKPDIILLDMMMPDMGGIEVLKELQADRELGNIPVMMISGACSDKQMQALFGRETNCREFVSKTTALSWIGDRVRAILAEGSGAGQAA